MPNALVRDFIPEGSTMTDAERQRTQFAREPGTPQPQATGIKADPIGSAQAQVEEAMQVAKANTKKIQAAEERTFQDRIAKMESMLANQAVAFLQDEGLSQFEREAFLHAEIAGKNRTTVLSHFGWA